MPNYITIEMIKILFGNNYYFVGFKNSNPGSLMQLFRRTELIIIVFG
jgi:hypothetical protein